MPVSEGEGYAPLDPDSVRTHVSEPPASSEDTSAASDSHPGADESGSDIAFDERHEEAFNGLLYLGALTKTFKWLGHTFVLRTLMTNENLAIGLMVKEWDGTIMENRAYATACVAACVLSVDGQDLPGPAFEETDEARLRRRFNLVASQWYPWTVDAVFNAYLELNGKVQEVLDAMGEAYGQAA